MSFVFHCRFESYVFLLVATILIITFANCFVFFTNAYIHPTYFVKCSSLLVFTLR